MPTEAVSLLIFTSSIFLFAVSVLAAARLLSPSAPNARKNSTYECGEIPVGEGRTQFMMQYFQYAIYFVIFDVFTTFILICATSFVSVGTGFLASVLVFVGVAAVGSVYSWQLLKGG